MCHMPLLSEYMSLSRFIEFLYCLCFRGSTRIKYFRFLSKSSTLLKAFGTILGTVHLLLNINMEWQKSYCDGGMKLLTNVKNVV